MDVNGGSDSVGSENNSESTFSVLSTYSINFALLGIIFYLIYKIFKNRTESDEPISGPPPMPRMKKRDFTLEELKEFDGLKGEGRVCIAVNGKVFDVTRNKAAYGPQGSYAIFAGRDATRGLATFSFDLKDEYDDLSDLKPHEMDSVLEWEMQFKEKYDYVGKLLKPGESHNSYSDDESESTSAANKSTKKED